jgi:anti-sigma regulatory factor (Ser/Thr protein kinase)
VDTVLSTLSVSVQDRVQKRLLNRMASNVTTFVLENDPELLAPLISHVQGGVAQMGICGEADLPRLGVALQEALTNALYHGNLEVSSELRELDYGAFLHEVEARRLRSPYRERPIRVKVKLARNRAVFVIGDAGPGFNLSALPDPTCLPNLEKSSGRGIFLMRIFMDRVVYNASGNAVTLVKYRQPPTDSPGSQAPNPDYS